MFHAFDVEDRIRPDHPLRAIREVVDSILAGLSPLLASAYSDVGRPGIPPEMLLKALLLQCLYSVRSERQLVERIDTDLLFRWFCGMDPSERVFDASAFAHNRPRLDRCGATAAFFAAVRDRAIGAGLASDEHFSVDGTLIESHASIKSFRPEGGDDGGDSGGFKPRNPEVDFRGERPSNQTHRSSTDPQARLYRKSRGHEAMLCHMGHVISENRNGLVMSVAVTAATGHAEREAALAMVDELRSCMIIPRTLAADRGYDCGAHLEDLEQRGIEPHVALRPGRVGGAKGTSERNSARRASVLARRRMECRTRSDGYRLGQRARKKVEEVFAWCKTVAGLARARHVGRWKILQQMQMAAAAYNLVRMRNLAVG